MGPCSKGLEKLSWTYGLPGHWTEKPVLILGQCGAWEEVETGKIEVTQAKALAAEPDHLSSPGNLLDGGREPSCRSLPDL